MSNIITYVKRLFGANQAKPPSNIEERVSWLLKPYMSSINDALSWKDPTFSLFIIILINLLFWCVQVFELRPLGILGGFLLCLVLLDALATYLGAGRKQTNLRCRSSNGDKLSQIATNARQWLSISREKALRMRKDNPAKFCFVTCSVFGTIYFLGNSMGSLLWHSLITAILLSPLLPNIQNTITNMQANTDSDGEVDEFLPNITQNVIEELEKAGQIFQELHEPLSLNTGDISLPNDANTALLLKAAGEIESSEDDEDDIGGESTNLIPKKDLYPSLPSTSDSSDDEATSLNKRVVINKSEKIIAETVVAPAHGWLNSIFTRGQNPSPKYDSDNEFELIDENDL